MEIGNSPRTDTRVWQYFLLEIETIFSQRRRDQRTIIFLNYKLRKVFGFYFILEIDKVSFRKIIFFFSLSLSQKFSRLFESLVLEFKTLR